MSQGRVTRVENGRKREGNGGTGSRESANAFLFDIKRRATMPEVAEKSGVDLGLMILWC